MENGKFSLSRKELLKEESKAEKIKRCLIKLPHSFINDYSTGNNYFLSDGVIPL